MMTQDLKKIKLKTLRLIKGLYQKDLARLAGISRSYVSMIERGERNPSEEIKKLLAQALDIPEELLFEEKEE